MASAIEKALAAQYAGNGPMFMPSTPVSDLYAGMYPTSQPRQNPLAPSQGGSWPNIPQRPRATALSPQNYSPTALPHDNSQRLASGQLPFINYPGKPPIDITVRGGATQTASVPMPQRRPWDAPTTMDLAAIAGQGQPQAPQMGYAPPPQTSPAVASAMSVTPPLGLSPLTASERINQPMPGAAPTQQAMTPSQRYDFANGAAEFAAGVRDRSGVGTDGYVRNASGGVIGRDAKYQGMNPDQMYNAISGRPQDDSWKSTFSKDQGIEAKLRGTGVTVDAYLQGKRDGTGPTLSELRTQALRNRPPASLADAMTRGSTRTRR